MGYIPSHRHFWNLDRRVRSYFSLSLTPISPGLLIHNPTFHSSGVGVGIGSNFLRTTLFAEAAKLNIPLPSEAILDAGPLGLQSLAVSPAMLRGLRESFAMAVTATNIASTVAMCVSVLTVFGKQRRNLKHVAAERARQRSNDTTKDERLVGASLVETKST